MRELLDLEEAYGQLAARRAASKGRRRAGRIAYEMPVGPDAFVVEKGVVPEGHERLTRMAASGLSSITPADLHALREGVRRPDTEKLVNHIRPEQQRRHSLRRDLCQPLAAALRDIRNQLGLLHTRALHAMQRGARREAFEWIGEALHLIQDSYSPAHVERGPSRGGRYPIVYIRYYGLLGDGMPREHGFPFDPRDLVSLPLSSTLFRWAAVAVSASREFLHMMLQYLDSPASPRNRSELQGFLDWHLFLSTQRTEPIRVYPIKCRVVPHVPVRL